MVLALLTLAAALAGQTAVVSMPVPRAVVTVTPDTVELTGAGALAFEPDITAFTLEPSALNGTAFASARLWFDVTGKPSYCQERRSPQPQAAQIACAQMMKAAKFALYPGMTMPFRRGFVDIGLAYVPGQNRLIVVDQGAYANTTITYPDDQTPDSHRLTSKEVSLASPPIASDDYPPVALRNGWESVSVMLLGIDRTGRVQTCRPLSNGGDVATAYLDNMSCRIMVRRASFTFAADAPAFSGVRYLRQRLRWGLPH